ncbi:unnamed protein product [Calypogeia fissa]
MICSKSPVSRLQDSPLQNSDSPQVASEILSEELINGEDGEEESREKRFKGAGKEDEVITYKRRSRIRRETEKAVKGDELYNYERKSPACGSKRKHPDDRELENCENVSDWETDRTDTIDQTTLSSSKLFGKASKEADGFGRGDTLATIKTWKRVIGIQKTLAPKRVIGQYFLDLGQSDFSYTTCRTCGLFYARGHENDEKVHKTFHKNRTQGITFKGWQSERVASRLDDKGNRVIVVLPEDSHHQAKVREVIDVMELELGLTPGWLLQRSCKVYLFISSSKKIVGCLMAEPITSAFRVVSAQCQSSRNGVKLNQSDGEYKKPSIMATDLQSTMKESSTQRDRRSHEADKSEPGSTGGESCLLPKSSPGVSSKDAISASNLSSICVSRFEAPTHSPECTSKVKGAVPHSSVSVKQECGPLRDRKKTPKITDFFALKTRHAGSQAVCKSERDVMDCKPVIKGIYVKVEKDNESSHNFLGSGDNKHLDFRQLGNEEKALPNFDSESGENKVRPLASGSRETDVQDGNTREGRQDRNNVMVFGNIKFVRELSSRKRASKERAQDLGTAILCTKTPVPAVCGVRVIWVSHTERRKGIASYLLDAMRKTFCLGVVLEHSQFAFSQPTPEGRMFASRYCKTDEFLVYTTS